jgi:hypothetical protein
VLHNHYRRISKFGKGFKGRIGVVQIVIGKLLALKLPRGGNPWPRAAIRETVRAGIPAADSSLADTAGCCAANGRRC